eukprot:TRINITY_DN6681_c1_g1_i1.p1 TRINITY_DN6681_c1_g1~~TRINITY_DN6681_c1_g1_i1.p1  ORF type:complete len:594 (+),score=118.67 TRINITY_DN6681_c1_g1_i1:126-1907(+)
MLCVLVMTVLVSFVKSKSPSFKDNAADFIQAGFKITTRRGEEKKDYTKLEIEAQPLLMVHDSSSIDKNRVTIEVKTGDQSWEVIDTPPNMRGGVYKWTKSNIVPCVNNNVRIWVHGHDGTPISFDYPNMVNAASFDEIFASGYQPHKPENVGIGKFLGGRLDVTWTPVKCAVSYDVTYQKVMGGKAMSKQVEASHGNSISIIDGLDTCSEYEIRVTAVIGDEYSEENIVTFSTPPETNAVERLEPMMHATHNSLVSRWRGFEKLSCISEYVVSVCKQGAKCSESQKVERDDSLQFIEFKSEVNLEECSEYTLNIKPVHSEVDMEEKEFKFRTKSNSNENVGSMLFPVQAEVDDEHMVTVSWNQVKCANHYEVFQKIDEPEEEWERVGTTEENFFKKKGVPCTEYKYGVKVTIDDEESDIVDLDQSIKISPALTISDHTALVIEEKANGSMTFIINNSDENHHCKVEKYHIKYHTEEVYIDPLTLKDGKITISVLKESTEIQGRIKFYGFDLWTHWISSDSPLREKQTGGTIGFLLPVIIGSVIAVLVLIILIFLVLRNKKSQVKYDTEKAKGTTEESKKLNKQMDEIINSEKS